MSDRRVCGHDGEHDMPPDWRVYRWSGANATRENQHRHMETIWFSPRCNVSEQMTLL
jgi:DNA adenine methylase